MYLPVLLKSVHIFSCSAACLINSIQFSSVQYCRMYCYTIANSMTTWLLCPFFTLCFRFHRIFTAKYAKICALIYKKKHQALPRGRIGGPLPYWESLSVLCVVPLPTATAAGEFIQRSPRASLDFWRLFGGSEGKSRIKNMTLTTEKLRTWVYILLKTAWS